MKLLNQSEWAQNHLEYRQRQNINTTIISARGAQWKKTYIFTWYDMMTK